MTKLCKVCNELRPFNPEATTPKARGFNGMECYACKTARQQKNRSTPEGKAKANAATVAYTNKPGNREKRYAAKNAWQQANPDYNAAKSMEYHCAKLQRIPSWADASKTQQVYAEATAKGLSVDHIVPLRGELVSGLHVHYNLQLLPRNENSAKGNKWD